MPSPRRLVTVAVALASTTALAQSLSTDPRSDSLDRFLVLSESASAPPTTVRAETVGRAAGGSAGGTADLGVSQSVEGVVLPGLSVKAIADVDNQGRGFTPTAQVKYQFLRQADHGLNGAAGVRYKQRGFQSDGGEAEAFFSAGKRWGDVIGTANLVVGTELGKREGDVEGHVGVAYRLADRLLLGLNTRFQQELELGEKPVGRTGREFEMQTGAFAGYGLGPAELSLFGGWYLPRATMSTGPIGMLRLGLNF